MTIKNAIIFAAGEGKRLQLKQQHKSLLKIKGQVLIERLINDLIGANVNKIIIITGYCHQQFLYLETKYQQVTLIYNQNYQNNSTAHAGYLVKDYLSDQTLLISGDLVMTRNFFRELSLKPAMAAISRTESRFDWVYNLNSSGYIIGYEKSSSNKKLLLGEWSLLDEMWANAIKTELEVKFNNQTINNYQMVDILLISAANDNINIAPAIFNHYEQWDIDNINDLLAAVKKL